MRAARNAEEQNEKIIFSVKELIFLTLKGDESAAKRSYSRMFGAMDWSEDWQDANWRPRKYSPDQWAIFLDSAKVVLRPRALVEIDLNVTDEDVKRFHKVCSGF